ncbi:hypothetical protein BDA96_01G088200 [Sorghum bicolor]|uniref:Uncharacterized protein n=1 Tax=Sorghum bicolor TaxID=4558 RepID=A0A921RWJ9_SORBI|nr:hypothetical protein BDA96_01G088200 [Sorghum bicolor]
MEPSPLDGPSPTWGAAERRRRTGASTTHLHHSPTTDAVETGWADARWGAVSTPPPRAARTVRISCPVTCVGWRR